MSAALAAAPPMRAPAGPTLAGVLHEAWNDFSAGAHAECPVCGGPMRPRWSAGPGRGRPLRGLRHHARVAV